VKSSLPDL
jgi:hypothetical protein